mmetsp:Transcript_15045/g.24917  ORF Transcript_15045/g.24917 Transcript_15045/m.24917 type:complete len:254 (+) Transcript_15045:2523-3284(+)
MMRMIQGQGRHLIAMHICHPAKITFEIITQRPAVNRTIGASGDEHRLTLFCLQINNNLTHTSLREVSGIMLQNCQTALLFERPEAHRPIIATAHNKQVRVILWTCERKYTVGLVCVATKHAPQLSCFEIPDADVAAGTSVEKDSLAVRTLLHKHRVNKRSIAVKLFHKTSCFNTPQPQNQIPTCSRHHWHLRHPCHPATREALLHGTNALHIWYILDILVTDDHARCCTFSNRIEFRRIFTVVIIVSARVVYT